MTNLDIAIAAASKYIAAEYIEEYDLEEGDDVARVFDGTDVEFPSDTLFSFGEFAQVVVLVEDGVVVGTAVGGFEDNRGESVEGSYTTDNGETIYFDSEDDDVDQVYNTIYTDLMNLMKK